MLAHQRRKRGGVNQVRSPVPHPWNKFILRRIDPPTKKFRCQFLLSDWFGIFLKKKILLSPPTPLQYSFISSCINEYFVQLISLFFKYNFSLCGKFRMGGGGCPDQARKYIRIYRTFTKSIYIILIQRY